MQNALLQSILLVSIAVGSWIRLMITLGWIIGRSLALLFDPFESVKTMSLVVTDGKSNWLDGVILIYERFSAARWYVIIAVSFWSYPTASSLPSELAVCV
ncbi:uncharacterized protein EDB93DRAFT_1143480 [Suillus bovinus]|uniref:uncharacterized protein n=1 Tax=Suillus bovinus TaxID=48563 RepID=UPI001B8714B6|nr:uncharacterized protein EDB93DRAFT_1143480 [Suillus bovinus]KAG2149072.1 hypothetical protein EDB93DRAFT_1143480 [Suillus bovinus]